MKSLDRMTKLSMIGLAWFLIFNALFGFIPNGLGSWSAGIDMQRYTVVSQGRLGPSFLDSTQASWFQQASGDPVYGLFNGVLNILTNTTSLSQALTVLVVMPPPLLLYAAATLAAAREFAKLIQGRARRWGLPLLPLMFLLPVGRAHVMVLGYAGNALASGLVVLILWLLLRISISPRGSLPFTAITITLIFVLINTYHTWSTYFAILSAVVFVWNGVRRKVAHRPLTSAVRLTILAPLFWLASAIYDSNAALYARFQTAVTVLHTMSPLESPIGLLFPETGGPLAVYLRREPIFNPGHLSLLISLALFLLLLLLSTVILNRTMARQNGNPVASYGMGLLVGTITTVPALFLLGGVDLAYARGLEFASVTGPFIVGCALVSAPDDTRVTENRISPKSTRHNSRSWARWMMVLVVVFVTVNIVASAYDVQSLSHDELLSSSEAASVLSLSKVTSTATVIWSDDRVASAFLYYQPKAFVTFALAYSPEEDARAVISVFYSTDCPSGAQYLRGTGAQLAVVTSYMARDGPVQRAAPLVPAPEANECFMTSASEVYDNGAVSVFNLSSMYSFYGIPEK